MTKIWLKRLKNNLHLIQISIDAKGSTKSFTTLSLRALFNASIMPAALQPLTEDDEDQDAELIQDEDAIIEVIDDEVE